MIPAGIEPMSYVDGNYQNFITKGQNGTYNTHGTIVLSHELNNGTMVSTKLMICFVVYT